MKNKLCFWSFWAILSFSLFTVSCDDYDDDEVWSSIHTLEERMNAMETVMNAVNKNLYIKSVDKNDNGYVITFTDGSKAVIENGKDGINGQNGKDGVNGQDGKDGKDGKDGADGKDGDTLIDRIEIGENSVLFYLTDGRSFEISMYSSLILKFDNAGENIAIEPNGTYNLPYTIESIIPDVDIEVLSSGDIKAKVVKENDTKGNIEIKSGSNLDEYCKIVILASNTEKVVMKSFHFTEKGLEPFDNTMKEIGAESGMLTLEFLTNAKFTTELSEGADEWIKPVTRALEHHVLEFNVEANKGVARTATITVISDNGAEKLTYTINQKACKGFEGPDITIYGYPGDSWGQNMETSLSFDFVCTTGDAKTVKFGLYEAEELDEYLKTNSLAEILKEEGQPIDENNLEYFNSAGIGVTYPDLTKGKLYSFAMYGVNEKGIETCVRKDLRTVGSSLGDPNAVMVYCFASPGNQFSMQVDKAITFSIGCSTGVSGKYMCIPTEQLNEVINNNGSLKDLIDTSGIEATEEQLSVLQTDGFFTIFDGLTPETRYSCLSIFYDADGNFGIGVAHTYTDKAVRSESDPDGPPVEATGYAGDQNFENIYNSVTFNLKSMGVVEGRHCCFPSDQIDDVLNNSTTTITEIVESYGVYLTPQEVEDINANKGFTATYNGCTSDTEYAFIYNLYDENDKCTSGIIRVTTEKREGGDPIPEVEVTAVPGNMDGKHPDTNVMCNIRCITANAVSIKYALLTQSDWDYYMSVIGSPEEIIMNTGDDVPADYVQDANMSGISVVIDNRTPDTEYVFGAIVFNADGVPTAATAEVKTLPEGTESVAAPHKALRTMLSDGNFAFKKHSKAAAHKVMEPKNIAEGKKVYVRHGCTKVDTSILKNIPRHNGRLSIIR